MCNDNLFSPVQQPVHLPENSADPNDPFASIGNQVLATPAAHKEVDGAHFSLPFPPKWMRKPVGCNWGFGGNLVTFDAGSGSVVTIKTITPVKSFSDSVDELEITMSDLNTALQYCSNKAANSKSDKDRDIWIFLKSIFSIDSRQEILEFVGYPNPLSSSSFFTSLVNKLNIINPLPVANETLPAKEAASPKTPSEPFNLYPTSTGIESDVDKLVTQCILVGDNEAAVNLCLSANRLADAFVIAMSGPPELLLKARDEFFVRNRNIKSYSRILQSIAKQNLTDIVEHCSLSSKGAWKEILALICTHAETDDLSSLFSTLGARLEGTFRSKNVGISGEILAENTHAASLCYVGSGEFDRVVKLWMQYLLADEKVLVSEKGKECGEMEALQSFIEKLWLFRCAISYVDPDILYQLQEGELFPLEEMYHCLERYASIAVKNGKVSTAYRALQQIPGCFKGNALFELRDRVYSHLCMDLPVGSQYPFEFFDPFALKTDFYNENSATNHSFSQHQESQNMQNMYHTSASFGNQYPTLQAHGTPGYTVGYGQTFIPQVPGRTSGTASNYQHRYSDTSAFGQVPDHRKTSFVPNVGQGYNNLPVETPSEKNPLSTTSYGQHSAANYFPAALPDLRRTSQYAVTNDQTTIRNSVSYQVSHPSMKASELQSHRHRNI